MVKHEAFRDKCTSNYELNMKIDSRCYAFGHGDIWHMNIWNDAINIKGWGHSSRKRVRKIIKSPIYLDTEAIAQHLLFNSWSNITRKFSVFSDVYIAFPFNIHHLGYVPFIRHAREESNKGFCVILLMVIYVFYSYMPANRCSEYKVLSCSSKCINTSTTYIKSNHNYHSNKYRVRVLLYHCRYIIPGYEIVGFACVWSCVHDHTCWSC